MTGEVLIGTVDQIPKGEGRTFRVGGVEVAVFHTQDDEVYATQPSCPHLGGPLADGLVGGGTIVCPLHDRIYDLKTGCGRSHEAMTIQTYPVRLGDGGEIWLSRG